MGPPPGRAGGADGWLLQLLPWLEVRRSPGGGVSHVEVAPLHLLSADTHKPNTGLTLAQPFMFANPLPRPSAPPTAADIEARQRAAEAVSRCRATLGRAERRGPSSAFPPSVKSDGLLQVYAVCRRRRASRNLIRAQAAELRVRPSTTSRRSGKQTQQQ